jgi:hypothetical protein
VLEQRLERWVELKEAMIECGGHFFRCAGQLLERAIDECDLRAIHLT